MSPSEECQTSSFQYEDYVNMFDFTIVLCFVHTILITPSTQLLNVNSVFVLTHYMFQPCFWITFRWYTLKYQSSESSCHAFRYLTI
jgi:ascorbate-specific PTS system EIIC-type component UlaA